MRLRRKKALKLGKILRLSVLPKREHFSLFLFFQVVHPKFLRFYAVLKRVLKNIEMMPKPDLIVVEQWSSRV